MNKKIELFINIAAFQEMTTNEISEYFEIIKNNKSKLYCCNREYKKLPGGEESYFDKYPFSNSKKIFWEDCPWKQKFYSLKPPFIHKYNGNSKHCLVDFHNDQSGTMKTMKFTMKKFQLVRKYDNYPVWDEKQNAPFR